MPSTNPVSGQPAELEAEGTLLAVLQAAATANGNGAVANIDGFNGSIAVLISNGAGSCTVTIEGSFDNFATAQDVLVLGVVKLSDSGAGTNISRSTISGAIGVAANTSALYAIVDSIPSVRARISSAAGLGAGTNVTGCTVKIYAEPV